MKIKLGKRQIVSGVIVLFLFIMTLIMYFAVGLRYSTNIGGIVVDTTLKGFTGKSSLEVFKNFDSAAMGKDIYGSSLTIVIFSAFLLVTVVSSWFTSNTRSYLKLTLDIANYLLMILIFILSIVVTAEYIQSASSGIDSMFATKVLKPSGLSIAFLIISGIALPLVALASFFDKTLFKPMFNKPSVA